MTNTLTVQAASSPATISRTVISRNIYGHFSEHLGHCIYEGYWVGEGSAIPNTRGIRNDIVAALRQVNIPLLRWPGGCFADEYHWMDGIGPRDQRPMMVNTHWGGVTENNHFGTHEFLDLCDQLGCAPYICGNVGSGTVREMQQWVEYITFDGISPMSNLRKANGREAPWALPYFGVGNENWGCGGHMRPEFYADLYRQYQTYIRKFGDNKVYKIACGANSFDYRWTEVLMREAERMMDGLSLHYYTVPNDWRAKGSATAFDEAAWIRTLRKALVMEELVTRHSTIMDQYDPAKRVGMVVDEWGAWYDVEPGTNPGFLFQQNSLRDALVAGVTLNIFNNHADRVKIGCLAQTINVLQAMILTDGAKMVCTPTYHVFDLYQPHHDAALLQTTLSCGEYALGEEKTPTLSASASRNAAGAIHISLCNLDANREAALEINICGAQANRVSGRMLTAGAINAHNTFTAPDQVAPETFAAARVENGVVRATLPAKSVVTLKVE